VLDLMLFSLIRSLKVMRVSRFQTGDGGADGRLESVL
jgi:hypothetical protein